MHRFIIGAALTAAILGTASAQAAPRKPLSSGAPVAVIGMSDVALCMLETQRDNIGEAFYWCDRTIRRGEATIEARSVAYMHRGVLHLKTHDAEAAMKDIDASIAMTPIFGDAYLNRGNALFAMGRYEEAVSAYGTALEQGTTTPELVHYNRAKALQRLGRETEAAAEFAKARSAMPAGSPLAGRMENR